MATPMSPAGPAGIHGSYMIVLQRSLVAEVRALPNTHAHAHDRMLTRGLRRCRRADSRHRLPTNLRS